MIEVNTTACHGEGLAAMGQLDILHNYSSVGISNRAIN